MKKLILSLVLGTTLALAMSAMAGTNAPTECEQTSEAIREMIAQKATEIDGSDLGGAAGVLACYCCIEGDDGDDKPGRSNDSVCCKLCDMLP